MRKKFDLAHLANCCTSPQALSAQDNRRWRKANSNCRLLSMSRVVNAAFVERHNGTDRGRCSRKVRKSAAFSKSWSVHVAATRFSYFTYNFCRPVRTLRAKGGDGKWHPRTPAMAARLTDHVWSIREWVTFPAVQRW